MSLENDGRYWKYKLFAYYFCLIVLNIHEFEIHNPRLDPRLCPLREGLKDGTIDVIATDHAPHSEDEKKVEFDLAPFGISGLETGLPLALKLVQDGVLTLPELIRKLTINPAKIIRINRGTLKVGSVADVVVFDPNKSITVDRNKFRSKGKNSPFHGWQLSGSVRYTIVGGKVVFSS